MENIIITLVLISFPILMYLVFSCFNYLTNNKVEKTVFVITMCTSLYLSLTYNIGNRELLLFTNIPIIICYMKKNSILGIILSLISGIFIYYKYDINIFIIIIKYFSYLITYIALINRKEFNYLFLKIIAVIQGFFISFEYFMNTDNEINIILDLFICIFTIYTFTFFCLYLFKLADKVTSLYTTINTINEENKLKNSLFKLTHEIKNPIAVCKGYLDMINLNDLNKSKKYINIIKSEIDRSLNVMADFMEYSKIKINKEIFDIVMLMDDIYESFEILVKEKNIKFNYLNPNEEIYLWGDYERLKQVFVNILKNSIESIKTGGIISIEVKKNSKTVSIIISDNGIGMTDEELRNVKEMFYTTKKNGTGLGVALSNEIIVAHHGILAYESKKNIGTKCTIKLPI